MSTSETSHLPEPSPPPTMLESNIFVQASMTRCVLGSLAELGIAPVPLTRAEQRILPWSALMTIKVLLPEESRELIIPAYTQAFELIQRLERHVLEMVRWRRR